MSRSAPAPPTPHTSGSLDAGRLAVEPRHDAPVADRALPPLEPLDADADPEARGRVLALFSGAQRKGAWEPPAHLQVVAAFGGCEIDLTEADLLEGETVIEVFAFCGGVVIRVPVEVDVLCSGLGLFGHFSPFSQRGDDPRPPRISVRGLALFGGVDVRGPRRKRRRREKR